MGLADGTGITAPIASATAVAQFEQLVGAVALASSDETVAALDRASAVR